MSMLKKMKTICVLTVSLLLINCSNDDDTDKSNKLLGKTFLFPLVQSQEECDLMQQNSVVFNCFQFVSFESNAEAFIVFTDIANKASYTINSNTLILTLESADVAVESPMIFNINEDAEILTRISDNSNDLWRLEKEGVSPWDL